jgi:hypothetical protein
MRSRPIVAKPLRWVAAFVTLFSLVLVSPPVLGTAQNWVLPGRELRSLDVLDASFRPRASTVIEELTAQGWPVWIAGTRRDERRQAIYKLLGYSKTSVSKHLQGQAMDVHLALPWVLLPLHAQFYTALRAAAERNGLCSGARWLDKSKAPIWGLWGLGWDPGHVESCSAGR